MISPVKRLKPVIPTPEQGGPEMPKPYSELNEIERIGDQMRRSFSGEAWHGPALGELLAETDTNDALRRPLPERHSIWEIVLHLNAWHREAHLMIEGQPAGDLSPTEDWPPIDGANTTRWEEARREFSQNHEQLLQAVLRLDESKLDSPVEGTDYSVYFLLHGIIQHDLYHAGQIALLKSS
jgi:uncharacterized damage-inducible protein DinB